MNQDVQDRIIYHREALKIHNEKHGKIEPTTLKDIQSRHDKMIERKRLRDADDHAQPPHADEEIIIIVAPRIMAPPRIMTTTPDANYHVPCPACKGMKLNSEKHCRRCELIKLRKQ